jgi:hypothetical protein
MAKRLGGSGLKAKSGAVHSLCPRIPNR